MGEGLEAQEKGNPKPAGLKESRVSGVTTARNTLSEFGGQPWQEINGENEGCPV